MEKYVVHWFRRDLRIAGNEALKSSFTKYSGRVVGLFTFDKAFLSRNDFSANRFQLFLATLKNLREELRACGSDLLVLDIGPQQAFPELLAKLQRGPGLPAELTFCRDYEPFARHRDKEITAFLNEKGVVHHSFRDHLLIEPHELGREGNGAGAEATDGYKVFSPFAQKWFNVFTQHKLRLRIERQAAGLKFMADAERGDYPRLFSLTWSKLLPSDEAPDLLQWYIDENAKRVTVPMPPVGTKAIWRRLNEFAQPLVDYGHQRDYPAIAGTSRFSMYLKNGSLTTAQVAAFYDLQPSRKATSGPEKFYRELIWREFYYHILWHWPQVEQREFIEKYRNLPWENNSDWFERWKQGRTGFPIVDAGMRELATTGWMHNRVRMIVASFLTKHLLIDWRWGEKYFMEQLIDGDLAANNGGWQWAASTGCDPQPYFRIFNPWLQSQKFDGNGAYIKKYVPELAHLSPAQLHQPILNYGEYPPPMVEHREQRQKALALYKSALTS